MKMLTEIVVGFVAAVILLVLLSIVFPSCSPVIVYEYSPTTICGKFSDARYLDGNYIIQWPDSIKSESGILQVRQRCDHPYIDTWEYDTGIVLVWQYHVNELWVSDPNRFFGKGGYSYKLTLF